MSTATAASIDLLEYVHSGGRKLEIDRTNGVIRGVKILGEESGNAPPNNNVYPRATREAVRSIIEGARSYVDHAPKGALDDARSYRDAIGVHKNIREEGDGLFSDFHFNPKHPLAEQLLWDAEHAPDRVGFSLASKCGKDSFRDGKRIIEQIAFDPRRHSIDLVSRPATTRGINESLSPGSSPVTTAAAPPAKKKVRDLIESLKATRPGYSRALREMAEAGVLSPDQPMDTPDAPPPDVTPPADASDHEDALKQGFRGAIVAVLDDDSLDMKGKLQKIKEIMTAEEKLIGGGKGKGKQNGYGKGMDDSDDDAQESLRAEVAATRLQMTGRDMVADAGLKATPVVRKALEACRDEAEVKALVESLKAEQTAAAPPSPPAAPLLRPAGAKSAGVTPGLLGIQESLNGGQTTTTQTAPTQPAPATKFEGERAAEQRINFLRGNGRR